MPTTGFCFLFLLSTLPHLEANQDNSESTATITVDEAKQLVAKHQSEKSTLALDTLTSIDERVAEVLSQTQGQLSLNGLDTLTTTEAQALGNRVGPIALDGITTLTPEAADQLSRLTQSLSLAKLVPTAETLRQLTRQKGQLRLGIESLSVADAQTLSQHEGILALPNLLSIRLKVANELVGSNNELVLDRVTEVSEPVARVMSEHSRRISLAGLVTLDSPPLAAKLASQRTGIKLDAVTHLTNDCLKNLVMNDKLLSLGLTDLTLEQAELLSMHNGRLWLNSIKQVTPEVSAVLQKHDGILVMNGLVELESQVLAAALARHEPTYISMNQLKSLSEQALEELAKAQCPLILNGLESFPAGSAQKLAGHRGTLSLLGLTQLTDNAAASIVKNQGKIYLRKRVVMTDNARKLLETHPGIEFK